MILPCPNIQYKKSLGRILCAATPPGALVASTHSRIVYVVRAQLFLDHLSRAYCWLVLNIKARYQLIIFNITLAQPRNPRRFLGITIDSKTLQRSRYIINK
jgi:hypothetical protein